jgi:hypothetical protein
MSTRPRARLIAFYLPQFHPIPENDEWWGKGFTEWSNVARARPLYPGHMQPKIPGELGFYDLRVPETRALQSALARQYGVEGFCYWHYWFAGRRLLERPFSEVLESGQPDFPFCLGWANQTWTGIWHGAPDRVLIEQTYGDWTEARRHFETVLPAFLDKRYLRVQGRPLFVLHMPHELPEPLVFTNLWREWARAEGLPGLFFVGTHRAGWPAEQYGFDGMLIANPDRTLINHSSRLAQALPSRSYRRYIGLEPALLTRRFLGWPVRIPYRTVLRHAVPFLLGAGEFPTVLPNWDNTPRSGHNGVVFTGSSPELFAQHLEQAVSAVESRAFSHRLVFLKSWNEWAEGNFVEPDLQYGRSYLDAIQRVVYAHDLRSASAQVAA